MPVLTQEEKQATVRKWAKWIQQERDRAAQARKHRAREAKKVSK